MREFKGTLMVVTNMLLSASVLAQSAPNSTCVGNQKLPSGDALASVPFPQADPVFSVNELYYMSRCFFESFIYPQNQRESNMVNSTFFSENVLGRVDATRNFVGRELNTEYIYGLFSNIVNNTNPAFFTLLGTPVRYDLSHWAGAGNVVSAAVINHLQIDDTGLEVPFEIDLWLTYDHNRQISQYDATFRYLQWAFDSVTQTGMRTANMTNSLTYQELITKKLAGSICSIAQSSCNGTNEQYDSEADCMDYLTKGVRFGQTYEMGMNTLLCRMVHQGMVPMRPDVHCSHIGKSGGQYCVDDRDYAQAVTQTFFTHNSFVGMNLPGKGDE